jgi:hypothetical protein
MRAAAGFHLLAGGLQLAHVDLGAVDLHRARHRSGIGRVVGHRPERRRARDGAGDGADDDEHHDGADDGHHRVAHGLFLGRLHQLGQADIEQIEAVEARQGGDHPQRREDLQHAEHPAGGAGIGGDLERLEPVLLAVEAGRQGVDDQGQHEHRHQGQAIGDHGADDRRDEIGLEREAEGAMAEHLPADQAGDNRDRGQNADIADIQSLDRRRFGVDPLPLGRR